MEAFALVRPKNFYVFDEKWGVLFKGIIRLPGGTEVEEVETRDGWTVVRVNDIYYPPVVCRIQEGQARALLTRVKPGSGPRTSGVVVACGHRERDRDCLTCWMKHWTVKAREAGIEFTSPIMEPEING
jgi:hypothetical protein